MLFYCLTFRNSFEKNGYLFDLLSLIDFCRVFLNSMFGSANIRTDLLETSFRPKTQSTHVKWHDWSNRSDWFGLQCCDHVQNMLRMSPGMRVQYMEFTIDYPYLILTAGRALVSNVKRGNLLNLVPDFLSHSSILISERLGVVEFQLVSNAGINSSPWSIFKRSALVWPKHLYHIGVSDWSKLTLV